MLRQALLLCAIASPALAARPAPRPLTCDAAIAAAERSADTAPGLLHAIGLVESGRRDPRTGERHSWPWTVSAEGVGTYYASKADAITAVQTLQARGITSIDVGCMQVNLFYHPGRVPLARRGLRSRRPTPATPPDSSSTSTPALMTGPPLPPVTIPSRPVPAAQYAKLDFRRLGRCAGPGGRSIGWARDRRAARRRRTAHLPRGGGRVDARACSA